MNKKLTIVSIPFLALSLLAIVSCSGGPKYNQKWYAIGYGSYINGSNWSVDSGIELTKTFTEDYEELFVANNVNFSVGDTFIIANQDKSIILEENNYVIKDNSFASQNVALYDGNSNTQVDIIKDGKYNISLALSKKNYQINITNGTDTSEYNPNDKPTDVTAIDFYGNGDQHGVTIDTIDGSMHYPEVAKYVSYLKDLADASENEDIFISNGDLWQGTLQSNANSGAMLNKVIESAGYVSFTLGNHEFDWGQDVIRNNQSETSVSYLGANIVNQENGQLVDYVQPFTIVEKSGLRVGIIGVIGEAQIEDILSTNVSDIDFASTIQAIKSNSDRLRTEFNCDMIVASCHDGTSSVETDLRSDLSYVSPISGKRYVDGVFTAHDHVFADKLVNNIPILNSANNDKYIAFFSLQYDDGVVSCVNHDIYSNSDTSSSMIYDYPSTDEATQSIVNQYYTEELQEKAVSVAGVIDSSFSKTLEAPNLMAKAMYEYAHDEGYDVCLGMVNNARSNLPVGEVTYTDLFASFPFTNRTIIMNVKGSDLRLVSGNYAYSATPFTFIDDQTYLIAVYDYLAFHQNYRREYDYFLNRDVIASLGKYPVDLAYDYMKEQTGTILASDYSGDNFNFLKT